jgi:hypothetical protein
MKPGLPTVLLAACLAAPLAADNHVMVVALAEQDYTREKFADGRTKPESYVVMPGNFFGGATIDRTLERMPFRKIATYLAHEFARCNYWPATNPHQADLLFVVHWGVTSPRASIQELAGRTNLSTEVTNTQEGMTSAMMGVESEAGNSASVIWDVGERGSINSLYAEDALRQQADQNDAEAQQEDTAQLLGLAKSLKRYNRAMLPSVSDTAIRHSLKEERYFVIVKVYDLRKWEKGKVNRAIWTVRLNIGAPGNNFEQALSLMSKAGVEWYGRTSDDVVTVRATNRKGEVNMPPVIILGEQK